MRLARWLPPLLVIAALAASSAVGAVNLSLGPSDIERALKLARASEPERARIHAPYRLPVEHPLIERLEVITEFRRFVLTAEDHVKAGDWMFTQGVRQAEEALRPWRGRLSIVARLRFHPLNTYSDVPPFDVLLGARDREAGIAPLDIVCTPIRAFATGRQPGRSTPLVGAVVETVFDAAGVGQAARSVILLMEGKELVRVTADFARLE